MPTQILGHSRLFRLMWAVPRVHRLHKSSLLWGSAPSTVEVRVGAGRIAVVSVSWTVCLLSDVDVLCGGSCGGNRPRRGSLPSTNGSQPRPRTAKPPTTTRPTPCARLLLTLRGERARPSSAPSVRHQTGTGRRLLLPALKRKPRSPVRFAMRLKLAVGRLVRGGAISLTAGRNVPRIRLAERHKRRWHR